MDQRSLFAIGSMALVMGSPCTHAEIGGCGEPTAGDCCAPHETPFCDETDCCKAICSIDPICCILAWDQTCVGQALRLAECCEVVNDDCAGALEIFDGDTLYSNIGATTDGPALPGTCDKGFGVGLGADIWYVYNPTCGGTLIVSTCSQADYDSRLAAYTGSCGALVIVACNDDGPGCGLASEMLVPVSVGVPIRLRVGGFDGAQGSGTLTLACAIDCPGQGACCATHSTPGCSDADCCGTVCGIDLFCCVTEWDEACVSLAMLLCSVCGPPPPSQSIALGYNWNGVVHGGEPGAPDSSLGYRSIADRGLTFGTTTSLGGVSGTVDAILSYSLMPAAGSLDTVYIGGPRDAGNGVFGFDPVVDGDNVGVAPGWDPTAGTSELLSAPTSITPLTVTSDFALGLLCNSSVGGGTFDLTLGLASGLQLTVTIAAPDWFADFNGGPPPPGPGVAIQHVLAGPLSGGDGFAGTEGTDAASPGAPLNVVEVILTYGSLLEMGASILGEELASLTVSNAVGGNESMTVGIYAASVASGSPCPADVDGNGTVNVDDLVNVILAWGPCPPPCPEDITGDGTVSVPDMVAVILGWGPCR